MIRQRSPFAAPPVLARLVRGWTTGPALAGCVILMAHGRAAPTWRRLGRGDPAGGVCRSGGVKQPEIRIKRHHGFRGHPAGPDAGMAGAGGPAPGTLSRA